MRQSNNCNNAQDIFAVQNELQKLISKNNLFIPSDIGIENNILEIPYKSLSLKLLQQDCILNIDTLSEEYDNILLIKNKNERIKKLEELQHKVRLTLITSFSKEQEENKKYSQRFFLN